jgi:pimeloyl-ACP methyl ester carboxylesterase
MNFSEIDWEGYKGIEFDFEGTPAKLIRPNCEPNGKWAYKTEYFGAFPNLEKELLSRGWHIAFNKNFNRWAEPYDLERKVRFMKLMHSEFGLSVKCAMVGMSCGGMYAVKLAAIAPELVACLYLDAPVINLLSCPFGLGEGIDTIREEYVSVTGRDLPEMLSYRENPLDKFPILAENNIPILLVCGDSDKVVPYPENGALLDKYYREVGKPIQTHVKQGCDHHPHGLDDPTVIADFIEANFK